MSLLAHGTGGSTDLPIPVHVRPDRCRLGVDSHVRACCAGLAEARFDPAKPGVALPRRITALVDASDPQSSQVTDRVHRMGLARGDRRTAEQ